MNVLAAARDEPPGAEATTQSENVWHGQGYAKTKQQESDGDPGAARWAEVLDLLASAGESTEAPTAGTATSGGSGGQIDNLFSSFGGQRAPAFEQASEEVRAQVLQETLSRLLHQKTGAETTSSSAAPEPVPAWQQGVSIKGTLAPRKDSMGLLMPQAKIEGPLDKFIRVFRLDALAAKCLRALEDDEVAYVIESCQGRLAHAKNPSAVTMNAIKGVAARVGRRYYGSRYNSDLQRLLEAHSRGLSVKNADKPLEMFAGSPASPEEEGGVEEDKDPYGESVNLEDIGGTKRPRSEIETAGDAAPDSKLTKGDGNVAAEEEEGDDADDDDDTLFFVDTGA
jgi:hypothetical protein